jgi:hypothetical protein
MRASRAPDELVERTVTAMAVEPYVGYDLRHSWWEVTADDGWRYPLHVLEYAPQVGDQLTVWLRGGVVLEAFRFNQGPILPGNGAGLEWGVDTSLSSPPLPGPW